MRSQVESMGARVDLDSSKNGNSGISEPKWLQAEIGRLRVHAEMVGSIFAVCGFGLPHVRKACCSSYHACSLRKGIPPDSITEKPFELPSWCVSACVCVARVRKRRCTMSKSKRLWNAGARFFGCAPPPPATVGTNQRCGKTSA